MSDVSPATMPQVSGADLEFAPDPAMIALGLSVRREQPEDANFLRDLYISLRWEELAEVAAWGEAEKIAFLTQQFAAQRMHYAKAYAAAEFLIIEAQGQAAGRIAIYRGVRDIRVVDIGLLPPYRSRGYGSAILKCLFLEGTASGRAVSVHVEVFNPAQRLYQRLGFREIGENGPYKLMEWRPD
jgi:ribosomal protein S18 acetylase RimI-like enzyme